LFTCVKKAYGALKPPTFTFEAGLKVGRQEGKIDKNTYKKKIEVIAKPEFA